MKIDLVYYLQVTGLILSIVGMVVAGIVGFVVLLLLPAVPILAILWYIKYLWG